MTEAQLLKQQVEYYRARAAEYDEWFFRQGRYDRGPEHRAEWLRETTVVEAAFRDTLPHGDVLELACGTGLWTRHLAKHNSHVLAVDASPEAIKINRDRVQCDTVEYVVADLFSWVPPAGRFDAVFFAFWLSHVPMGQFDLFWAKVRSALKPNGVAFFVDGLLEQTSSSQDHDPLNESGVVRRRLNDGREFEIVKVFYEPVSLEHLLAERDWRGWVRKSGSFFLYGSATPIESGSLAYGRLTGQLKH